MVTHDPLLQVALHNVPLFRAVPKASAAGVLMAIAQVTGMPVTLLLRAEQLVLRSGSIAPLQALLNNPAVPRAEHMRFEFDVQYLQSSSGRGHQGVAQCLTLMMHSARGQAALTLAIHLERNATSEKFDRQTMRVMLKWLLDTQSQHQICKHEITLAGDRPRRLAYAAAA